MIKKVRNILNFLLEICLQQFRILVVERGFADFQGFPPPFFGEVLEMEFFGELDDRVYIFHLFFQLSLEILYEPLRRFTF